MLLPDHLRPGLRAVLCGVAPAGKWDGHRRYYAGRGNAFWPLLYASGLVPVPLGPDDDEQLPGFGLGLTDLAKTVTAEPDGGVSIRYDVAGLDAKIGRHRPLAVAFTSKAAAQSYARGARLPLPHDWA